MKRIWNPSLSLFTSWPQGKRFLPPYSSVIICGLPQFQSKEANQSRTGASRAWASGSLWLRKLTNTNTTQNRILFTSPFVSPSLFSLEQELGELSYVAIPGPRSLQRYFPLCTGLTATIILMSLDLVGDQFQIKAPGWCKNRQVLLTYLKGRKGPYLDKVEANSFLRGFWRVDFNSQNFSHSETSGHI